MGYFKTFSLIVVILFSFSCNKSNTRHCIKTNGEYILEKRIVSTAKALVVEKRLKLNLIQDSSDFIEIYAGKNLIPFIEAETENDTIYFRNKNKCNFIRSFEDSVVINYHFTKLEAIRYESAGAIRTPSEINIPKLKIHSWYGSGAVNLKLATDSLFIFLHTGPGDVNVAGKGRHVYIYSAGQGFVDTKEFNAQSAHVSFSGSGKVEVFASSNLLAEIFDQGDVYYYGNPSTVNSKITGKGKLIKQEN